MTNKACLLGRYMNRRHVLSIDYIGGISLLIMMWHVSKFTIESIGKCNLSAERSQYVVHTEDVEDIYYADRKQLEQSSLNSGSNYRLANFRIYSNCFYQVTSLLRSILDHSDTLIPSRYTEEKEFLPRLYINKRYLFKV